MEREKTAKTRPVSRVAFQGKEAAPKTIRTAGIRRTSKMALVGRTK